MTTDWEAKFRDWSKPSSETEQEKYENAERMIRDAIRASDALRGRDVSVFAKGSYRNNTNVRQESDVDIVVVCRSTFYTDYTFADYDDGATGVTASPYGFGEFKNDVGAALVKKFGAVGVTRGNKAFDVHANTYRVDADVVAGMELRRYRKSTLFHVTSHPYASGTVFFADDGERIENWPAQQLENGTEKNNATGNRYKYIVRAMKRLRNEMADHGITAAKPIPSYLIECLVWNAPHSDFGHPRYCDDVRAVIVSVWNGTKTDEACKEWGEVNEMKYLFRHGQPWSRDTAHAFLLAAWGYVGFA
ncbi:MAG: nucleotidyltransferase [Candidatus Rokubacteria bacterium]|nr:nucleotidyltransferase [Candidatus Rokubacteria bacterium]